MCSVYLAEETGPALLDSPTPSAHLHPASLSPNLPTHQILDDLLNLGYETWYTKDMNPPRYAGKGSSNKVCLRWLSARRYF